MASGNKKKAGRPPGSTNRDYEKIAVTSTRCPRCGHTEFVDRKILPFGAGVTVISGFAPDGKPYNRVRSVRAICANPKCGKPCSILEYELIPEKEPAGISKAEELTDEVGSGSDHGAESSADAIPADAGLPGGGGV